MDVNDIAGGPPPLTRLQMKVHTSESGARSLAVSFLVNKRQLLLPDFEAAAHDAILKHAHASGHLPVGPVLITVQAWDGRELGIGTPDAPLVRTMEDLALKVEATNGNIVKVIGECELGASLL